MSKNRSRILLPTLVFLFLAGAAGSAHANPISEARVSAYASTVSGTVYDQKRSGLPYVDVELQNDRYQMIQHTTTDGIGRYQFDGLADGRYYVRVMPFKYDMDEQSAEVEITTISAMPGSGGSAFVMQDFYLTPRKGTLAAAQAEVVVAQEIPKPAQENFNEAAKLLKKGKTDDAIPLLEAAIKEFPEYFLANDTLGQIYFHKNDYEHAAPLLLKAVGVYDKSPMTLYMLGVSFAYLKYYPTAIMALKTAATLAPQSSAVHLALGKTYLSTEDYKSAEASLLEAKKYAEPATGEIFQMLARVYKQTKQYSKAAASLESMLKNGNYSPEAREALKKEIKDFKAKAAEGGEKPAAD